MMLKIKCGIAWASSECFVQMKFCYEKLKNCVLKTTSVIPKTEIFVRKKQKNEIKFVNFKFGAKKTTVIEGMGVWSVNSPVNFYTL